MRYIWIDVTRKAPCPICGKPDWCRLSSDGRWAACRRQEQGAVKSKRDKNGAPYYLHRINGTPVRAAAHSATSTKKADNDTLNRVYSALLAQLYLSKADRDNLKRRGLSDEDIDRNGYRTLPIRGRAAIALKLAEQFRPQALVCVPGFATKEGNDSPYLTVLGSAGLVIPVRDPAGWILALLIRRDKTGSGGKYPWMSSTKVGGPSSGAPPHVPLGHTGQIETIRLTEGALKSDVATALSDLLTIGTPGIAWRTCIPVLQQLGAKTIRLAYDADFRTNSTVCRALLAAAESLTNAGYALELETWDIADGKGIDDVLAAGKQPQVLCGESVLTEIRAAAVNLGINVTTPSSVLERLHQVLDEHGGEGLFRDRDLLASLAKLFNDTPAEFAAVRASLKGRVALRDLDRVLRPLARQLLAERPAQPAPLVSDYLVQGGRICRQKMTADGPVVYALCNFSGRIVEEVIRDDGAEQTSYFTLEGTLMNQSVLPKIEVPASEFNGMNWVTGKWGSGAILNAGMGTRDHVRCALQLLSPNVPRRMVYGHTGWREIGGQWVFLHAGGALGALGAVEGIETALPDALSRYELPTPPQGDDLVVAVRASLRLLELGPDKITIPAVAAIYRAALGGADFSIHVTGPTGCYKTELAALIARHYGAGQDARNLPANWSGTGNALEATAFAAKDVVLIVDDFVPTGHSGDLHRMHREADRLLRGQGNRAGRQRMRADGSLRPTKYPRGLIVSTGEDSPRGQSLRARLFTLEVSPGDLGPAPPTPNALLSACQHDASEGLYARCMAAFIVWLAPRYGELRGKVRDQQATLRNQLASKGQHARTPSIAADLALGLRYFLEFARDGGVVTEVDGRELWERGRRALHGAANEQAANIAAAEPTDHYLRLLSAALGSGRAHLATIKGDAPLDPDAWGWRQAGIDPDEAQSVWKPQGKRIGWIDAELIYLEPEAAFAEAQELARQQGDCLVIAARTLTKRLHEKGLLASIDRHGEKTRLTVRRTIEGRRREVICISMQSLSPDCAPSAPIEPEPQETQDNHGRTPTQEVRQLEPECANWRTRENEVHLENAPKTASVAELAHLAHCTTAEKQPEENEESPDHWGAWQ